jgi:hypothetical protein
MTDEVKEPVTETAQQPAPAAQSSAVPGNSADLNISDLVALKSIIEIASQRGAFKAAEMEAVGKTFNRLTTFLDSVSKKEA